MKILNKIKKMIYSQSKFNFKSHKFEIIGYDVSWSSNVVVDRYHCLNCDITLTKDRTYGSIWIDGYTSKNIIIPSCNEIILQSILK